MLPVLEPFTPLSVTLSLLGLVLGVAIWTWLTRSPSLRTRVYAQAREVRSMLLRQMSFTVMALLGVLLLSRVFAGNIIGDALSLLSIIGGMVFWAYVGALVLHIVRSGPAE
ncbi:MAG: hypothetical protein HC914_06515 [Chloroflexaceae bacterium]|nr:hypothetical protein [Chloroflexaceae bacterium]